MLLNESVHNDDLGEIIGNFHGIPVRSWNKKATRTRELVETKRLIAINRFIDMSAEVAGIEKLAVAVPDHEFVDNMGFIRPMYEAPGTSATL